MLRQLVAHIAVARLCQAADVLRVENAEAFPFGQSRTGRESIALKRRRESVASPKRGVEPGTAGGAKARRQPTKESVERKRMREHSTVDRVAEPRRLRVERPRLFGHQPDPQDG